MHTFSLFCNSEPCAANWIRLVGTKEDCTSDCGSELEKQNRSVRSEGQDVGYDNLGWNGKYTDVLGCFQKLSSKLT